MLHVILDRLPKNKRARLEVQPYTAPSGHRDDMPNTDTEMVCPECGKSGHVRYGRMAGAAEGYGNPDSWGSAENDARGEWHRAQCTACLAEWQFET